MKQLIKVILLPGVLLHVVYSKIACVLEMLQCAGTSDDACVHHKQCLYHSICHINMRNMTVT